MPFPKCSRFYAKAAGFSFSMPSRRLLYVKAVQGERRAKSKAAGYSFSMPSRRLLYVKVLRESALLLPRWGDKAGWLGNPGCRLATLGFALGCELYAPSGRSLTALNFYRTPIIPSTFPKTFVIKNLEKHRHFPCRFPVLVLLLPSWLPANTHSFAPTALTDRMPRFTS